MAKEKITHILFDEGYEWFSTHESLEEAKEAITQTENDMYSNEQGKDIYTIAEIKKLTKHKLHKIIKRVS